MPPCSGSQHAHPHQETCERPCVSVVIDHARVGVGRERPSSQGARLEGLRDTIQNQRSGEEVLSEASTSTTDVRFSLARLRLGRSICPSLGSRPPRTRATQNGTTPLGRVAYVHTFTRGLVKSVENRRVSSREDKNEVA